ncbi:MAG: flavin reductase [Clostridia bacterium]|nr:flavin reductase [Clostridia bacterium]
MKKISQPISNAFCPQGLYLYGTYTADSKPNYGLFCWATYCHSNGFRFVACIGEDKLTRDRIRETGVFSASILTEALLPAADWCGTHAGYEHDKSSIIPSECGSVLHVPIPCESVWSFELKVEQILTPSEGSDIYICRIEQLTADARLSAPTLSFEEKLKLVSPVVTMDQRYLPVAPHSLGEWGSLANF